MKPIYITERDHIYIEILKYGLQRIRDCSALGLSAYCAVEAEHIHSLPSLIGDKNELRHAYYFQQERGLYLEKLDRSIPGVDFTLSRYSELWESLRRQAKGH